MTFDGLNPGAAYFRAAILHGTIIHPHIPMARHTHYETAANDDPALDISSLIDVTFLLLIYFLITSAIQIRETDLRVKLPTPGATTSQPHILALYVRIGGDDTISVGEGVSQQVLDTDPGIRHLPLLAAQLGMYASAARSTHDQPLVQLWADNGATQQRVVDVLNTLAAAKIHDVTFTDLTN